MGCCIKKNNLMGSIASKASVCLQTEKMTKVLQSQALREDFPFSTHLQAPSK